MGGGLRQAQDEAKESRGRLQWSDMLRAVVWRLPNCVAGLRRVMSAIAVVAAVVTVVAVVADVNVAGRIRV